MAQIFASPITDSARAESREKASKFASAVLPPTAVNWAVRGVITSPPIRLLGKLRAVTWIGCNGSSPAWGRALAALILVIVGLNVVGAVGFPAKAHIGQQVEGETAIGGRLVEIQGRISVQESIVAVLDRQITQIDNAIAKATDKGRTKLGPVLS